MEYLVGIDEVGRGPLAGPVAVGVLVMKENLKIFGKIRDSKKLSVKQREEWFKIICAERQRGALDFSVSFISHITIDKSGLAWALRTAIARSLARLANSPAREIFFYGGLWA